MFDFMFYIYKRLSIAQGVINGAKDYAIIAILMLICLNIVALDNLLHLFMGTDFLLNKLRAALIFGILLIGLYTYFSSNREKKIESMYQDENIQRMKQVLISYIIFSIILVFSTSIYINKTESLAKKSPSAKELEDTRLIDSIYKFHMREPRPTN